MLRSLCDRLGDYGWP